MGEKTHVPGGVLSVVASDDGRVACASCHDGTDPGQVYMLLRVPGEGVWVGLCHACARDVANVLMDEYLRKDLADIVQAIFPQ